MCGERDAGAAPGAMPAMAAPDEGMAMGMPVGGGPGDRLVHQASRSHHRRPIPLTELSAAVAVEHDRRIVGALYVLLPGEVAASR